MELRGRMGVCGGVTGYPGFWLGGRVTVYCWRSEVWRVLVQFRLGVSGVVFILEGCGGVDRRGQRE